MPPCSDEGAEDDRSGFEGGSPSSREGHELKKLSGSVICLNVHHAKCGLVAAAEQSDQNTMGPAQIAHCRIADHGQEPGQRFELLLDSTHG